MLAFITDIGLKLTEWPFSARCDRGPLDQLPADMRALTHNHAAFGCHCLHR